MCQFYTPADIAQFVWWDRKALIVVKIEVSVDA
jgi:hypothetical protein